MALVSSITKKVELPHEAGEFVVIRKLGVGALEDAAEVQLKRELGRVRDMGGMSAISTQIDAAGGEEAARRLIADAPPHTKLDRRTCLQKGIASWSYKEPVTASRIDDLDEETANLLHREIAELSRPRTEADAKNS